jgi:hypothetical protein
LQRAENSVPTTTKTGDWRRASGILIHPSIHPSIVVLYKSAYIVCPAKHLMEQNYKDAAEQQQQQQQQQQQDNNHILSGRANEESSQHQSQVGNVDNAPAESTSSMNNNSNSTAGQRVQRKSEGENIAAVEASLVPGVVAVAASVAASASAKDVGPASNANAANPQQPNRQEKRWNHMYRRLQEFVTEHGHFRVSGSVSSTHDKLFRWLVHQRKCLDDGTITLLHAELLSTLGVNDQNPSTKRNHNIASRKNKKMRRRKAAEFERASSSGSSSTTTTSTPAVGVAAAAGSKRPRPAELMSSTSDEQTLPLSSTSNHPETMADQGGIDRLREREKQNHSTGTSSNSSCSNIATAAAAAVATPGNERASSVKHVYAVEKPEHGNGTNGNIRVNISLEKKLESAPSWLLPDDWSTEPVTRLRRAPNENTVVDPTVSQVEHVEHARVQATTILSRDLAILCRAEVSFSSTAVSKYVAEPFLQSLSPSNRTGFTIQLTQRIVTPTDSWWELVVDGLANVVDLFQAQFKSWIKAEAEERNYELLFQHGICLTARMDKSMPVGASLTNMRRTKDPQETLRLSVKPGGQLGNIIGPNATARGGAVLAVNGKPCHTIAAYKQVVQDCNETHVFLTFCVDRHADLSGLQVSLLALPPWLLDATPLDLDAALQGALTATANASHVSTPALVDAAFARTFFQSSVVQGPNDVARPVVQSRAVKASRVDKRQATATRRRKPRKVPHAPSGEKGPPEQPHGSLRVSLPDAKSREVSQAPSLQIPLSRLSPTMGSTSMDEPSASQSESTPMEKVAAYRFFLNKYKDVVSLEYSCSGIVTNMAASQMWRQHKKSQYGPICSDNCNCLFDLPLLTATVVETKVKAELKNPKSKWNKAQALRGKKSPTGFVDGFAPKFLPMLKAEFPHESPQQLLHRLLGMWQHHLRQRNFGLQCNDTCACMEGWCQVFRKGHVQKQAPTEITIAHTVDEEMPDPREQTKSALAFSGLSSGDSRQNEDSAASKLPRIPKKRKANSGLSSLDTRQDGDSTASNLPRVPKKRKAEALGSLISGLIPVHIPPTQATNEESKTDGSGMLRANLSNRVPKKKTNAAATSSQPAVHAIGSGSLLRSLAKPEPELPKKAKKALPALPNPQAMVGHGEHKEQSSVLQASSEILRSSDAPPSTGVGNGSRREPNPPADTWVTVDTKRTIRVEDLPKPILKDTDRGGSNAGKRRVQFGMNPINEYRFYDIDSKTTEFQIKSSDGVTEGAPGLSTDNSKDQSPIYHHDATLQVADSQASLSEIIRNKSFKDVLSFLEHTKVSGARSSERLEEALRIVKDSLASIDAKLALKSRDEALRRQRRDFEFKKSFIKICINEAYALQFARSLKNWVRFEIVVTMIDKIQLSDHAMLEGGENVLSAEVTATYVSRINRRLCLALLDTDARLLLMHSANLFICFKLFLSGSKPQRAFAESSIETGIVQARVRIT